MLDSDQLKILNYRSKSVFINAGAGSGKTRVIITKIKDLIEQDNINPNHILAITFTNKAAEEMKKRLDDKLSNVYTFHSFCYKLLLENNYKFKLLETNANNEQSLLISNYKNSLFKGAKPRTFNKYQKELNNNNLLDFDDLIIKSLNLIKMHSFKYVFIDEFQDINNLQYEFLRRMNNKNTLFWAVGDKNQSIYKFRGANNTLINKYINEFSATEFYLNNNYRCSKIIVDFANILIGKNYLFNKPKYICKNSNEGYLKYYVIKNKDLYYNNIFSQIRICSKKYREVSVLYRYHYEAREIIKYVKNTFMMNVKFHSFHEAKGLEFDCVIIINASSTPSLKSFQYKTLKEEIRLLYVGFTRAKTELIIYSQKDSKLFSNLFVKLKK